MVGTTQSPAHLVLIGRERSLDPLTLFSLEERDHVMTDIRPGPGPGSRTLQVDQQNVAGHINLVPDKAKEGNDLRRSWNFATPS